MPDMAEWPVRPNRVPATLRCEKMSIMTDALFRMRFVIPQLWIGLDAVGASFELDWDGSRVRITLPSEENTFSDLPDGYPQSQLPSLAGSGPVFAEPDRDARTASLILFEVTVEMTTNFPSPKPTELTDDLRKIADDEIDAVKPIAEGVASSFVRHVRAFAPRQSWLGLSTHAPAQYGIAQLEYRDTGERILGYGPQQSVTMRSSRLRLDVADVELVVKSVAAQQEPGIPESLLADAWHLSDAQAANDQDRAILVAATACEVKVKQFIQDHVGPDGKAMAMMILNRRSNLPELLDEVLLAILGVSLKKENKELFQKVVSLAAQRNAIIHGGRRNLKQDQTQMPAQVGSSLFEWLDALDMN